MPPILVASTVSAAFPVIGEAADQTSQPWERYKQQIHSNFPGFVAESQQSITTAINNLDRMPITEVKRNEAKACLIQERAALNTLAKASTFEPLHEAQVSLSKSGRKFAEFKDVTPSFVKSHLAATSGMIYAAIKIDEIDGYSTPDKATIPWANYMDKLHKIAQESAPNYKFSKSEKFVSAIHNFYATSANDTASKSRDTSKESMAKPGNQ